MARPGYKTVGITLKQEDVDILDSLGDSRSDTVARLARQEAIARQNSELSESAIAVTERIKATWSREQKIDLILELVRSLA